MRTEAMGAVALTAAIGLAAMVAFSAPARAADAGNDATARVEASRAMAKAFAQSLQQALQTAIATGGPLAAIEVCNSEAPAIAARQSVEHGAHVSRVSLKPRNPADAPDDWQRAVLTRFNAAAATGEPPAKLETWEVVETDGKPTFRYMRAIPTGEMCLSCHGANIAPELAAKLSELYPGDPARGYAAGDIRGAFSIDQPLAQP